MGTLKFIAQYVGWLVLLALPLELYFIVSGLGNSPRLQVHEAGLVTVPQPNTRVTWRKEGFSDFAYNANGLRGPEVPPTPAPGKTRVAFLGDSYTEAYQVQTDEIFTSLLDPQLEVLNYGMSGDNLLNEILRYRTVVRPRRPHVVVLVSTDGDLLDIPRHAKNKTVGWDGQDVVVDQTRLEWNNPATRGRFELRQRLRDHLRSYVVFQRFKTLMGTAREKLGRAFGGPAQAVDAEMRSDKTVPPENVQLYAAILARLKADVEADGARLIGLHLPKGYTLRDDITAIRDAYRQAYAKARVPLIDTYDALDAAYQARQWTHYRQPEEPGSHLTAHGHAVVGQVLRKRLPGP